MRPYLVEAPVGDLIDIAGFHLQSRVATATEDALIMDYQRAAVSYLDGYSGRLGRCILLQKWALPLTDNSEAVFLPFPDCREFTIEKKDEVGDWRIVAGVTFEQIDDCVVLTGLPDDASGIVVMCVSGWVDAASVPDSIKQIVRLIVGHWFENRSAVVTGGAPNDVPLTVEALISPLTTVGI